MSSDLGLRALYFLWGALTGCFCEQCREGAKYSDAIISPNLEVNKIMRVPHAVSLSDCSAACCDLAECDLAWMFERHCYIVSCPRKGNCEPKNMEKVRSYLTFVVRSPQRRTASVGYGQEPPNMIHSMSLPGRPSEEMSHLKELSILGKEPHFGEAQDYPDEYGQMEQNPFQLSVRHEEKGNVNFADWALMGPVENEANASGLTHGDHPKELAEKEQETLHSENPTNGNESKGNPVTQHPGEFPEISLGLIDRSADELGFQPPSEANSPWSEAVLTPTHNPPPSDILGSLSTATAQTSNLGDLKEDETTSLPKSDLASQLSATNQGLLPTAGIEAVKELLVSAGDNLQLTLPKNDIELHASVIAPSLSETAYSYKWSLIGHPDNYGGEMEGRDTPVLKVSQLTAGTYLFKVSVSAEDAFGEGFVNVTVKPAVRKNQPPIAIVSPKAQDISVPTTSTVIDGNQSTDDAKIVSYHWEEIEGPLREKASADTPVLHLSNLIPGNYTFRLTVIDSDGVTNSTLASLTVHKQVDFPPVANAGPNQEVSLPQNTITLNGNQSKDDREMIRYEWSLSPKSKKKMVAMEGVKSPYLQLSSLQEGNYTFQLIVTDSVEQQSTAEVTVIVHPEKNRPPTAVAGPDKELTLPVQSTFLDGSRSTDDVGIVYYHWESISGPGSLQMENADRPVATVSGLQVGTYYFRLTVKDGEGLSSTATLSVAVKEEKNHPPQARAGGKHILVLPNNSIALDGSQSTDDHGIVSYLWIRDGQSPAAGDVIHGSDHNAVLQLTNLVEGSYTFHLKVTDSKGDSDVDTAVVEVQPDPRKNSLVELILQVKVGQLTEQQKDTLVRQLAVLLNVLDSDIKLQKIQPYSEISTAVVFYVQNGHSSQAFKASDVAQMLRLQLLKEKTGFLLFQVLRVDTAACLLKCSGHGYCDPITKQCICYELWMENLIQGYLGNGESNCEWSILYVTAFVFALIVLMVVLAWFCIYCCKSRKRTKIRKKTKYTILDNIDDQERMELRPKYGIKHRSTEHNSSLMVSESEFDSDQDTIFSREKSERENPRNNANGSIKNGVSFSYSSKDR
ncbi:hypothetical protein JRQ81_012482 [Phrynocephalus forsythii]|uniref:MANSC domain-containing protein n=1 Tax=Phrynocephalus forsythii TaxID=171643 RepID=A0A9Q0Y3W5_9SAUR|nr:hypothetical protein JRQ81_012482 [Phrynocephalus forsythii]